MNLFVLKHIFHDLCLHPKKKIVSPEGASWLSRYLRWSSFPPHCQRWRSACQPQSQDRWESTREPRGNWIHPSGYGIIFDGHSKLLSWKRSWVWSPTFWNVRNGNSHLGKSTSPRYIKLNSEISQPFLQWPDLQRHAKCWNGLAQNGYIYIYIYVQRHYSATISRTNISNKKCSYDMISWYVYSVQCAYVYCIYTNVLVYLPLWLWHSFAQLYRHFLIPLKIDPSVPTGLNDPRLPAPLLHHPKAWPRAKEPAVTVSVDKPRWHPKQLKDSC